MKVSVFIPTYNCQDYIEETLRSVLDQSYRDIEILCVDDGSTDSTYGILNRISASDTRVRTFFKANQGSVPYSWNYIFPKINGAFTLYMSHDDILAPDAIQLLVEKVASDSEIDCVIPSVRFFRTDIGADEPDFESRNLKYSVGNRAMITGAAAFVEMLDYSIPGFALWRTETIRSIGMITESFNSDELMQRIWIRQCRKVAFSEAVFGYRQIHGSIVSGLKPQHIFSLDTNLRLFEEAVKANVPAETINHLAFIYFKSTIYLAKCLRSLELNHSERKRAITLLNRSYETYRNRFSAPFTLKNCIYRILAASRSLARIPKDPKG